MNRWTVISGAFRRAHAGAVRLERQLMAEPCRPTSSANTAASVRKPDRQVGTPAARWPISSFRTNCAAPGPNFSEQLRANC
jgi:hypothetical protein